MEFKGTKGSWFVGQVVLQDGVDSLVVSPVNQVKYDKGYRVICDISPMEHHDEEDIANAQLISKAPEMLPMIERMRQILIGYRDSGFDTITGDDAIKDSFELIKEATNV